MYRVKKDDDDIEPIPENQEVTFKVDLIKMTALDIKEGESGALEVYGFIDVKLIRDNITDENALWSANDDDHLSVELSDYPLTSTVSFTVDPENISDSNIELTAALMEHDFSDDIRTKTWDRNHQYAAQ